MNYELLRREVTTWTEEVEVRGWCVERAEQIAAAPFALPDGWVRLTSGPDEAWNVAALADLIRGVIAGEGVLSLGTDWYRRGFEPFRDETDAENVTHDTTTERVGPTVPKVLESHKARPDGQIRGKRRGVTQSGATDRTADGAALDDETIAVLTADTTDEHGRITHKGLDLSAPSVSVADLVAAADRLLMADDHETYESDFKLMGTDEFAWAEMTPPLFGDVRIDVDGRNGSERYLATRRDVIDVLQSQGHLDAARANEERAIGQVLTDGLAMTITTKPTHGVATMGAATKLHRQYANKTHATTSIGLVPSRRADGTHARFLVTALPNATTDGRTVILYRPDGTRVIESTKVHAARVAERERSADRIRKATAAGYDATTRAEAVSFLAALTEGQEGTFGDWRVMLVRPAESTRKVAAIVRAVKGEESVIGAPRKVATLLAR